MHLAATTQKVVRQIGNAGTIRKAAKRIVKQFYLRLTKDEECYISEVMQHPSKPSVIINNLDERRFIIGLDNHHYKGHHRY